jgi:c(7)-type cytochrome triheme protein
MYRNVKRMVVVLGMVVAASALADGLPNLPPALKLPQTGDSPGLVTFNHESHVDAKSPGCVSCHPKLFGILGRSSAKRAPITHAEMEKGSSCGACHGKEAFAFEDCTMCHAQ